MSKLKVALLQLLSSGYDQDANQVKGEQFCRQAHGLGADIALFPEMWNIGYQLPDPSQPGQVGLWQEHAIDRVASIRRPPFDSWPGSSTWRLALTYLERWQGGPRNSLSLIDRHGEICLTYAKVHTCDFDKEIAPDTRRGFLCLRAGYCRWSGQGRRHDLFRP